MIYIILGTILLTILALKDQDFLIHSGWYIVTLLVVLFVTGCSSIPPSPYDNEPFIWID